MNALIYDLATARQREMQDHAARVNRVRRARRHDGTRRGRVLPFRSRTRALTTTTSPTHPCPGGEAA